VDGVRLGAPYRALRLRGNLRQSDLAGKARVPREVISEVENGRLARATLDDLRLLAVTLGADLDVRLRWRGERLDRLLDEAHAATIAVTLERLATLAWETAVEASFSIWGERGSIDILAWHPGSRTLLVIEVKSTIPDLQATLHDLDRKVRLAPEVASRFGWTPRAVGRLLVVAESPTSRGRVRRSRAVLDVALPIRGAAVRSWLREPRGPIAGIWFLSNAGQTHAKLPIWRRERVRPRRRPASSPTAALDKESAVGGPLGAGPLP
jgi:transcriptional regulator with XRE-family HTH domain